MRYTFMSDGYAAVNNDVCYEDQNEDYCGDAIDKLSAFEDAEEHGRMVILPCKVGDTLYAPTRNFVSEFRVSQFDFGGYEKPYLWVEWHLTKGFTGDFRLDGINASEIGKTVFLAREEAEATLKGGHGDV